MGSSGKILGKILDPAGSLVKGLTGTDPGVSSQKKLFGYSPSERLLGTEKDNIKEDPLGNEFTGNIPDDAFAGTQSDETTDKAKKIRKFSGSDKRRKGLSTGSTSLRPSSNELKTLLGS